MSLLVIVISLDVGGGQRSNAVAKLDALAQCVCTLVAVSPLMRGACGAAGVVAFAEAFARGR
jgi:hypothetical protein